MATDLEEGETIDDAIVDPTGQSRRPPCARSMRDTTLLVLGGMKLKKWGSIYIYIGSLNKIANPQCRRHIQNDSKNQNDKVVCHKYEWSNLPFFLRKESRLPGPSWPTRWDT